MVMILKKLLNVLERCVVVVRDITNLSLTHDF
jgi:hypothetical protein